MGRTCLANEFQRAQARLYNFFVTALQGPNKVIKPPMLQEPGEAVAGDAERAERDSGIHDLQRLFGALILQNFQQPAHCTG